MGLDEIVGKVTGMFSGDEGGTSGLMRGVMEMLANRETGGLGGLVKSFQEKGLGDIISTWVGTGANMPISAEQIQQGMGSEMVQNLAAKVGIPPEELKGKLAELLPGVIDKLTPDGTVPEGGLLEKGLEFFKGRLS